MQINYLGHSCFKIKSKDTVVVTDPFNKEVGLKMAKTPTNIVTISHQHGDHNCLDNLEGEPFVIQAPGEYEIADVSVFGISTFHDQVKGEKRGKNTIYDIKIEDISLCHLGDLGHKLSDKQVEEVNGVDVLFIPVGGVHTLDPKQAVEVISQIEPTIVIPMHYKTKKHGPLFKEMATLEDFLKEVGSPELKPVDKLVISKTSLPEEREIVALSAY